MSTAIASIVAPTFLNLLFAGIFAHVGDVQNERDKALAERPSRAACPKNDSARAGLSYLNRP